MIKLIAMDMDGTLLNRNDEILPKTKEALMTLQRKGIRLVLASGRSYTRLLPYAKELRMDKYGGYLIEINGGAIYDVMHDKREKLSQIEVPQIHELFTYFMKWDVEILAHLDDGLYDYMSERIYQEKKEYRKLHAIPKDFPWTPGPFDLIFDSRKGYPHQTYIKSVDEIQESVNKVSVAYHEEVIQEIREIASVELKERYWIGLTSPRWLEIMPLGVNKGKGLKIVGERLGIDMKDMMAFGDGENDVEMLKAVGIGIAMENALGDLKSIADEVTNSHEKEGIANALYKHFDL